MGESADNHEISSRSVNGGGGALVDRLVMPLVKRHWGFDALRPLQHEAMSSILAGRDSIVVMPTGGGKSLCYQAPALLGRAATVVVSPLISLMKDQVDALRDRGVPAALVNSSLAPGERSLVLEEIRAGQAKLVYIAPERFAQPEFVEMLTQLEVRNFVVDEAHCISHWGHEFRPEYRQLSLIKERFPRAAIHAYTATATPHVRGDIGAQLRMAAPTVLVGDVDRPNLVYRAAQRGDVLAQIVNVLERHKGEAGIVYCLRRADVDDYAHYLRDKGYKVLPYHAGMTQKDRERNQNAFSAEKVDVIVATVAFGMGIDRSNVRFVVHAHCPKSVEHYQQEAGRAGRDGLEAECILFFSAGDGVVWRKILEKSAIPDADEFQRTLDRVEEMVRFCGAARCRHALLVEHFGQEYPHENCGACDICLGEVSLAADTDQVGAKILSCVARIGTPAFGAGHVADILLGDATEKVVQRGHDQLTTFGLLRQHDKKAIRAWIDQLVGLGHLALGEPPYRTIHLTDSAWAVMRGERSVAFAHREGAVRRSKQAAAAWEGVDEELFESLRVLRRDIAEREGVPPFVVFPDTVLRGLAAVRPTGADLLARIPGIGDVKLRKYGDEFLRRVAEHCRERGLSTDVASALPAPRGRAASQDRAGKGARPDEADPRINKSAIRAFPYFRAGTSVDEVAQQMGRARSTVMGYLDEFVRTERPTSIDSWVAPAIQKRVLAAAASGDGTRLRPVFDALDGKVPYDDIRLVLAHANRSPPTRPPASQK